MPYERGSPHPETTGDPHSQYATGAEFGTHAGRHQPGGADPLLHQTGHASGGGDAIATESLAPQIARSAELIDPDPATPANGRLWYNSTVARLKAAIAGAIRALMYDGQAAAGELAGSYPNPTVAALHAGSTHVALSGAAPVDSELGLGGNSGSGTDAPRSDHRHGLVVFEAVAPTTSAVGEAASQGTSTKTARRDHRHGREAFATVTELADVAAAEAAGASATVPRGDHAHAHGASYLPDAHHAQAHDHTAADGSGVLTNDEHDGFGEYAEIAAPVTPAANKLRLYAKDKVGVTELFYKNDAGTERDLSAAGGGGTSEITRINGSSGAAGADITWQRLTATSADVTTTTLSAAVMTTTGLGAGT